MATPLTTPLIRTLFHLALCAVALPLAACTPPAAVPYEFQNVAVGAGGFITGFVAHPSERGLRYLRTDIGGAYRWDATEKRWVPLLDWLPIAERNLLGIESLAIDPNDPQKLYLAAGTYVNARAPHGAILRSSDAGRHFEAVHLPIKMGGNEEGRFAGERLQVDPNSSQLLLLGTRLNGLWRSNDGAITWNRVRTFPGLPLNDVGLTFVAYDKASGQPGHATPVIFVGLDDPMINLLRSQDGGNTWQPVPGGPRGVFPNHGVFSAEGALYLSYGNAPGPNGMSDGAVWVFDPPTNIWRDITPERPPRGTAQPRVGASGGVSIPGNGQGFGYGMVAVDLRHPQTLLASTIDRWHPGDTIFRSTDAGAHWQSLQEGATRDASLAPWLRHTAAEPPFGHWIGAAMIDPFDSAHVLYGTGETVWESHDVSDAPTTHWTVGAPGVEESADLTLLSPPQGPHLFTGLADIGCFRYDDSMHSPPEGAMKNPEFSNCDALALAASSPKEMVRVGHSWTGGPHGAVSHDDGLHWTPFASEPEGGERGGDVAISADGKRLLWAIPGAPLSLSTDGGGHWRALGLKADGRFGLQVVAEARKPEDFWVYDPFAGALYALAGADGSTRPINKSVPKNGRLRVPADAPDALWIASGTGLFHSTDDGAQWKPVPGIAAAYTVGFGKAAPHAVRPAIYLAGALAGSPEAKTEPDAARGGGIYRSVDDGATWQRIDDPDHRYASVEQITGDPRLFGRVYLGTTGRGVVWGDPAK